MLSSNIYSTCSNNMVNFGPLAAEIGSGVCGTPANFNGFLVLAALLRGTLGRQPNFAALNRGRHLYSNGRPSRWALAHILVCFCFCCCCCYCRRLVVFLRVRQLGDVIEASMVGGFTIKSVELRSGERHTNSAPLLSCRSYAEAVPRFRRSTKTGFTATVDLQ